MTVPRFTLFIDGDCPLCRREAALMQRLDRGRGNLALVDIADPGFDPGQYQRTRADFVSEIQGHDVQGRFRTGMEAFREAYAAIGLGWLLAPTAWPVLRPLFDRLYAFFARNRLSLTGRKCDPGGQCPVEAK